MPIYWCIVRSEQLDSYGRSAFRFIKVVKTTVEETQKLYDQYAMFIYEHLGMQTMIFLRDPDELPFKEGNL